MKEDLSNQPQKYDLISEGGLTTYELANKLEQLNLLKNEGRGINAVSVIITFLRRGMSIPQEGLLSQIMIKFEIFREIMMVW